MISAVRHAGFYVNNIEKALTFYLGLGLVLCYAAVEDWSSGEKRDRRLIIKFEAKDDPCGAKIEFIRSLDGTNFFIDHGEGHVALTVDNLDETYQSLINQGVRFTVQPQYSPDKSAKVAFIEDPNGISVELVEPTK